MTGRVTGRMPGSTTAVAAGSASETLDRVDARARQHRVAHEGRVVAWREFGAGPPLVLLHGGHGSWAHWVRNIEALSARHTLWLPDMPGYGESDDLPTPLSVGLRMQVLVDTLAGSLRSLLGADTPVDLAGFSFGGLVAAQLAVQRGAAVGVAPRRAGPVHRLALLGTAGHGGARRPMPELLNWRGDDRAATAAALHHNLAALMLHEPARIDALAMEIHERSCRRTRFRSKAISRASPLPALLDALDAPVLLAWGEHDVTAHPDEVGPRLTEAHQQTAATSQGQAEAGGATRPERRWCTVPDAGHWVQYEQPAATDRLLLDWFAPAAEQTRAT